MEHSYKLINNNGPNSPESIYDKASFFSRYAFCYMLPLFSGAFKRDIGMDDIGAPPREDKSKRLGMRLQQAWQQELLTKDDPSFTRALIAVFGWKLARLAVWDFISKCIAYPLQAVTLGWLIRAIGEYLMETNAPAAAIVIVANPVNATLNATLNATPVAAIAAPVATINLGVGVEDNSAQAFAKLFNNVLLCTTLLILATMLAVVTSHPFFFGCYHLGMKVRIASCYVIYKKSLRLSQAALSKTTVGQMVNLLSNDVNRFDQAITMIPYLVMAPAQALVMLGLLASFYLGVYPTLAALATILSYVALQTLMGGCFGRLRLKTARRTDERVRLMNEIVSSIRVIKMYCWERSFERLVTEAREREVSCIAKTAALRTVNTSLFFVSSKVIVFVALITYISLGYTFTPENVFVSIALSNLVRVSLTLFFPNAVAQTAETLISCQRIKDFLLLPEMDRSPAARRTSNDSVGCKYVIELTRVTATWEPNLANSSYTVESMQNANDPSPAYANNLCPAVLRGLSMAVKRRDLVLIVGRVGSGKSSVLMSMLGELPISSGRLEINGRLSYASQEPWIFSGTVRENVLFGKEYHAIRYKEVMRVCNLERDMELLPEADRSIVGERGVSLSGGQKARVNLARALYYDADIYLLDDPLSAVDASVAKHIFNNCLKTFLKKKTVVLATHQLQFLSYATKVLVVDNTLPAAFGTLQEVMASKAFEEVNYSREAFEDATTTTATEGPNDESDTGSQADATGRLRSGSQLGQLLNLQPKADATLIDADRSGPSSSEASASPEGSGSRSGSRSSQSNAGQQISEAVGKIQEKDDRKPASGRLFQTQLSSNLKLSLSPQKKKKKSQNLVLDPALTTSDIVSRKPHPKKQAGASSSQRRGGEKLSKISADMSTYLYYLSNAAGCLLFTWFVLANFVSQSLFHSTDFWLSFWTDSEQRKAMAEPADSFVPVTLIDRMTLSQITVVYAGLVLSVFVASFLRTGTHYYGCLRASINMHNKLFSSILRAPMIFFDFSPIGILLNRISRDTGFVDDQLPTTAMEIVTIFVNVFGIIIVTLIINYWNIIPAIILLAIAFSLRHYSARTVRRLKQIEGVARSPIFSHLANTLSGISTIRAFTVQEDFLKQFDDYQDTHSSAWFLYIASGRWLTVAMDWLCLFFITSLVSMVLLTQLTSTNASLMGLLVTQAIMLPGPFQWGMRQLTELESQMTSVQRIKEYSQLESEQKPDSGHSSANKNSPTTVAVSSGPKFTPAEGEIMFCGVSLRYFKEEEPVLKNLNFHIRPSEKVGIVGRTGAGKSSIMALLFRLYDFDGAILIDSVDTKSMPLTELRPCISIIPQDPVLFSGSIRKNLDPFNEFTDLDLWRALKAVRLDLVFRQYNQQLDYVINEGGSNFSIGQRQLICLARAIVRRNKILVLDEATANVDPETDTFIQKTIRDQFNDCTVLTIAHRLITVMDSDRVLVLDAGQVREFDEPYKLLQNENGLLTRMTKNSGHQADRLYRIAKTAHLDRLKQQGLPEVIDQQP